jgi:6-pyruvoyltetrahydropterin/6-carboxytetrahydropterin synthase
MFRVGVVGRFSILHFLVGDFGDEAVPHRHDYRVEWSFAARELDANHFAVNIAAMESVLERTLERYGETLLNDLPFFRDRHPSVELTAEFLLGELVLGMREAGEALEGIASTEVKIWETETAWASVERPILPARSPQDTA